MFVQREPRQSTTEPREAAAGTFSVTLDLDRGYAFRVDPEQEGAEGFLIDEAAPLGEQRGPNPARVLASALAACLGSSLLFCLRKARVDVKGLTVHAAGTMQRNARGRLRVASLQLQLLPSVEAEDVPRMARCLEVFEDFCVVTESVRHGVEVAVAVAPQAVAPALAG